MSTKFAKQDYITVVNHLQTKSPKALLCGSVALMLSGLLDERAATDIDFVMSKVDFDNSDLYWTVSRDRYASCEKDGYSSYHGSFNINGKYLTLNLLVFREPIVFNTETINVNGTKLVIQKLDDILVWKQKYNRDKDIKDLDNIAKNIIERDCLQET